MVAWVSKWWSTKPLKKMGPSFTRACRLSSWNARRPAARHRVHARCAMSSRRYHTGSVVCVCAMVSKPYAAPSLAFFLLRFACDFEIFSPVSAARTTLCGGGAMAAGAGLAGGCCTRDPTIMPGMNFLGLFAMPGCCAGARPGGARPPAWGPPLTGAPLAFGAATLGAGMFPRRPGMAIAGAPPMPPALGAAAVCGLCCWYCCCGGGCCCW